MQLSAAATASTRMMIAFGERAGQRVRRIGRGFGYEEELPMVKGPRCSSANGFTIHANRYIGAQERGKLEELLSYGARGAFSNERLSLVDPDRVRRGCRWATTTTWTRGSPTWTELLGGRGGAVGEAPC